MGGNPLTPWCTDGRDNCDHTYRYVQYIDFWEGRRRLRECSGCGRSEYVAIGEKFADGK